LPKTRSERTGSMGKSKVQVSLTFQVVIASMVSPAGRSPANGLHAPNQHRLAPKPPLEQVLHLMLESRALYRAREDIGKGTAENQ
jgi:hypothetical protein